MKKKFLYWLVSRSFKSGVANSEICYIQAPDESTMIKIAEKHFKENVSLTSFTYITTSYAPVLEKYNKAGYIVVPPGIRPDDSMPFTPYKTYADRIADFSPLLDL